MHVYYNQHFSTVNFFWFSHWAKHLLTGVWHCVESVETSWQEPSQIRELSSFESRHQFDWRRVRSTYTGRGENPLSLPHHAEDHPQECWETARSGARVCVTEKERETELKHREKERTSSKCCPAFKPYSFCFSCWFSRSTWLKVWFTVSNLSYCLPWH